MVFFTKNIDRVNIMKIVRFKYYGNKITSLYLFSKLRRFVGCVSLAFESTMYCIKDEIKIEKQNLQLTLNKLKTAIFRDMGVF